MSCMTRQSWFDSWQGKEIFLFSKESILALAPIQPTVHWVQCATPPGIKQLENATTIHPNLVLSLRMSGALSLLPHAFTVCTGTILTSTYWLWFQYSSLTNSSSTCDIKHYLHSFTQSPLLFKIKIWDFS
jgi:hypothetical protein